MGDPPADGQLDRDGGKIKRIHINHANTLITTTSLYNNEWVTCRRIAGQCAAMKSAIPVKLEQRGEKCKKYTRKCVNDAIIDL